MVFEWDLEVRGGAQQLLFCTIAPPSRTSKHHGAPASCKKQNSVSPSPRALAGAPPAAVAPARPTYPPRKVLTFVVVSAGGRQRTSTLEPGVTPPTHTLQSL